MEIAVCFFFFREIKILRSAFCQFSIFTNIFSFSLSVRVFRDVTEEMHLCVTSFRSHANFTAVATGMLGSCYVRYFQRLLRNGRGGSSVKNHSRAHVPPEHFGGTRVKISSIVFEIKIHERTFRCTSI